MGSGGDLSPDNTIVDAQHGTPALVSPSGALKVSDLIRVAGGNFGETSLLGHLYDSSATGSGTVVQANAEVKLSTGTTANSTADMQTAFRARFLTATFNKTHQPLCFPDFNAANVRTRWGAFDPTTNIISGDGLYFENTGGTVTLVRVKGGVVKSTIAESSFNNTFLKDNTLKLYEIIYNAGSAFFYQNGKLIYKMAHGEVGYETVHLPVGTSIENINGNTANNYVTLYALACARIGSAFAVNRMHSITAAGSGVINDVPSFLSSIIITELGTGSATLKIYDSADSSSNLLFTADLSKELVSLKFSVETNNALSYVTTGAAFEVLVIYN